MFSNLSKAKELLSKGNSVESLRRRSEGALSIFKATVVNLQSVNNEIANEIAIRSEKIVLLSNEKGNLSTIKTDNEKFITKINEFLS